jgi:hypothetical protein
MKEPLGVRVQDTPSVTEISGGTRWPAVFWVVCLGGSAIAVGIVAVVSPSGLPYWLQRIGPVIIACMGLVLAATLCGVRRAWRIGLRLDDDGITISNFFGTHRLAWQDVSELRDGRGMLSEGSRLWALRVIRQDGSSVVAMGTQWSDRTRTALETAAQRHRVPANLTGAVPAP